MRSLGWVLIQHKWCRYKRKSGQTHTEKNMWRFREKTVFYKPKRGPWNRPFPPNLRRNQPYWSLWSWTSGRQNCEERNSRFTQPVASYCGSPSKLHTATKDLLSHSTQNPNTLPWCSGHLGPAHKWPLPPSPSPTPPLPAWLLNCTHSCSGLAPTPPPQRRAFHDHGIYSKSLPRPYFSSWHLLATQTMYFLLNTHLSTSISAERVRPLSAFSAGTRTGLAMWVVHSLDKKLSITHTFFPPPPPLSNTHTQPPSVPVNSQWRKPNF